MPPNGSHPEQLQLRPGMVLDSTYEIVRLVGEGGMGSVWEARHLSLRHAVAVKALYPHLASEPSLRQRFIDEGQLQAQFRHPNLVKVYDVIADGPLLAIVMEFVPGQTLFDFIYASDRPVDQSQGVGLGLRILAGLEHAHEVGVVHRDIKPDNVILAQEGAQLIPRLSDFGVAKDMAASGMTQTGTMMGTSYYISPEQIKSSRDVDNRSDIYSLGVTLYELFTQALPFDGETQWELMKQHIEAEPPPLLDFRPDLAPDIQRVVLKAMAKSPADRFQSCAEMIEALRGSSRVAGAEV